MKNYLVFILLATSLTALAQEKKLKRTLPEYNAPQATEIQWLTWEQAQQNMQIKPKKVYIDIFTDWCGWCKVMDKNTFGNEDVIRYMNQYYYCIKLNAEKDDNINLGGTVYKLKNGVNELANTLMRGKLSYPTSIFMDEGFANAQPVPGYLNLVDMEYIATYVGTSKNKTTPYEDYKKQYKLMWRESRKLN